MARRLARLSPWQVEVLQWIADGCPERDWKDHTYKHTAYALAERRLITVTKRRGSWQATVTDDGRFYLAHGTYHAAEPEPERRAGQPTQTPARKPAFSISPETLIAELEASNGNITLPGPSPAMRAAYRSAISRAITEHVVPEGNCLLHSGRDGGDLVIRLAPEQERARRPVPLAPVPIPATLDDAHPVVLLLHDTPERLHVSAEARDRALRIVQAIADECERRGYGFAVADEGAATFVITVGADEFPLMLYEERETRDVPDAGQLAAAKYSWQRIHSVTAELPTGRLGLRLYFGSGYRTRSWADRQRWRLDQKLPAMFQAIVASAAEQTAARERREAALRQRQKDWDAAVQQARGAYVRHLNRDRLQKQVARSAEAEAIRAYCARLDQLARRCSDQAQAAQIQAWSHWARQEAERTDPLNSPANLAYREPTDIRTSDIEPFMPRGLTAWSRPD